LNLKTLLNKEGFFDTLLWIKSSFFAIMDYAFSFIPAVILSGLCVLGAIFVYDKDKVKLMMLLLPA